MYAGDPATTGEVTTVAGMSATAGDSVGCGRREVFCRWHRVAVVRLRWHQCVGAALLISAGETRRLHAA